MHLTSLTQLPGSTYKRHGGTHPATGDRQIQTHLFAVTKVGNPMSNTTTLQDPAFLWVQEPNVRGTFGILTFCLSTLIICAWSALHFDIPKRRHRRRDHVAFGVIWTMVAVLCPEGLLAAAIYQRIDASILEGYASLYLLSERQAQAGWLTRLLKGFIGNTRGKEVSTPHLL